MVFGLAQDQPLRKYVSRMHGWVLATAAGYATLTLDSMIPFQVPGWLMGGIMFHMVGTALGILQRLVLRPRVDTVGWWVVISVGGWALACAVTGLAIVSGLYVEPFDMLAAFLVPTAVSGAGMARLLQSDHRLHDAQR
jgi:hypothetical protein